MLQATQVRCPSCNGPQALQAGGQYTCEYCLQPFTVADAQREASRLLDDVKRWVLDKVGSGDLGEGVDASSRSYIFQQRVLPEIQRDVDRSLEDFGPYAQFPLVRPPVTIPNPSQVGGNPLLLQREAILGLKNLRARLLSDHVVAFAVREQDRAAIQGMDRRLSQLVHMSNVADAAASGTAAGYAAARKNLEALLSEVDAELAASGGPSVPTAFLTALKTRYQGLVELSRACEQLVGSRSIVGGSVAERLERIAKSLQESAQGVEASGHSAADAMPIVIGIHGEVEACRTLAAWLRAYDGMVGRASPAFAEFTREVEAVVDGVKPEARVDVLEPLMWALQAARGERDVPVVDDFSWVDSWAERSRVRKSLGLFGVEERTQQVEQFLVPVWVVEVFYSKEAGTVFKEGVERWCIALVEACHPTAADVVIVEDNRHPLVEALERPRAVAGARVAMPRSTPANALSAVDKALCSRPDILTPRIRVTGLALAPAAVAHYESKKGTRQQAVCLRGLFPVDASLGHSWAAGQQLLARFG